MGEIFDYSLYRMYVLSEYMEHLLMFTGNFQTKKLTNAHYSAKVLNHSTFLHILPGN